MVLPVCSACLTAVAVVVLVASVLYTTKAKNELKIQIFNLKEDLIKTLEEQADVIKDKDTQIDGIKERKSQFEREKSDVQSQLTAKIEEIGLVAKERDDLKKQVDEQKRANTEMVGSLQELVKSNKPKPYVINENATVIDQMKGIVEYLTNGLGSVTIPGV